MQTQLNTILLATDGSEDALEAERAALDLHRQAGAALHVVHVWQFPAMVYSAQPIGLTGETYHLLEEGAQATLDASTERLAAAGGAVVGAHLRFGPVIEGIATVAQEIAADLVLIGSRGLGPVRRLVMGSVSEGVVHGAPCPVLVMRGGPAAWPPSRIIVGDDASDDATTAASLAAAIAAAVGAHLTLVQALPGRQQADQDERIAEVERELRARAQQLLGAAADGAHVLAASEDPAALLLNAAESDPAPALIAIGSRGLRLLERLRLGSVSTKVLHAASCPVLIASQRVL